MKEVKRCGFAYTLVNMQIAYQPEQINGINIAHQLPSTNNKNANLDPGVILAASGQAYLFWGNKTCYYAKLAEKMTEIEGKIYTVDLPGFEGGCICINRATVITCAMVIKCRGKSPMP